MQPNIFYNHRMLHFKFQELEVVELMKRYFELIGTNINNEFNFDVDNSIEFHRLADNALSYYRFNGGNDV